MRAMVDLALHADEGPVLRHEIAERQEVSEQYLAQLLGKLRRAGLVESVRGPGGGYLLGKNASQITASAVLKAVNESLNPVFCVDDDPEAACHRADGCPTRLLWIRLGKAIIEVLDSVTLAELCEGSTELASAQKAMAE